jgi:hypothetical protein
LARICSVEVAVAATTTSDALITKKRPVMAARLKITSCAKSGSSDRVI